MAFNKKYTRNNFKKMTIELIALDTDNFDCEELIGILETIPFNLININLTTSKSNVGIRGNGFAQIGFVNKFYTDEDGKYVFDVAIVSKHVSAVDELLKESDLGITAKVFTDKDGKVTKIIGLNLTPVTK